MALVPQTLIDGLLELYGEGSPTSTSAAADAWADALEDYIVVLTPPINPAAAEARKTAASVALLPVFEANAADSSALATALAGALQVWTATVALTFTTAISSVPPLSPTLITPLSGAFVLNLALVFSETSDIDAVTNIVDAIDAWVKTGTAVLPGPSTVPWS